MLGLAKEFLQALPYHLMWKRWINILCPSFSKQLHALCAHSKWCAHKIPSLDLSASSPLEASGHGREQTLAAALSPAQQRRLKRNYLCLSQKRSRLHCLITDLGKTGEARWTLLGPGLCLASHLRCFSAFLFALHNQPKDSSGPCCFKDHVRLNSMALPNRFVLVSELPWANCKVELFHPSVRALASVLIQLLPAAVP